MNNLNILVVEDVPIARKMAEMLLESLGNKVDLAEDGEKAVDFFKDRCYDFVFMDIGLPGIDGLEATKRIRKIEAERCKKHVPIVALTANFDESKKQICLDAGMNDFLLKPLTKKKAEDVIGKLVKKS